MCYGHPYGREGITDLLVQRMFDMFARHYNLQTFLPLLPSPKFLRLNQRRHVRRYHLRDEGVRRLGPHLPFPCQAV